MRTWTIGYTGQSPRRLKLHMKNMHTFDIKTLKTGGQGSGVDLTGGLLPGRRPVSTPDEAPGLSLYDHVQTRHGWRRLPAPTSGSGWRVANSPDEGSASRAPISADGLSGSTTMLMKKLGWWDELTAGPRGQAEGRTGKTDPGRRHPHAW